jgi:FtsZ-binding cell division protein ZapB
MKKEKENKENKEIVNSVNTENTEIVNSVNTENKDIGNSEIVYSDNMIEKEYQEIQKNISDLTKKGLFSEIVNLLKEKSDIIEKYQKIQQQKEREKREKIQEIENKIQEKIKQIDLIKEEIRELKEEKKQIQGYTDNNSNSKTRIINRENHEYQYNMNKTNKAIDIIYMVLSEYGITKEAWDNFNHEHSISWHDFINRVKNNKYPQKKNLEQLFNNNIDYLNQFYEHVKEITIS